MNYVNENNTFYMEMPKNCDQQNSKMFLSEAVSLCKDDIEKNNWIVFDASNTDTMTVDGLKEFAKLSKTTKRIAIINLSERIYDLFVNCGCSSMMTIFKTFKHIDMANTTFLGSGGNGEVYKSGEKTAIKIQYKKVTFSEILEEMLISKWAFIAEVPTNITYYLGKNNDNYVTINDYVDMPALSKAIVNDPDNLDYYIRKYVDFIKHFNSIKADTSILKNVENEYLKFIDFISDYIDDKYIVKLKSIIKNIPYEDTIVHGDLHSRNARYKNGEMLAIDMGTLSYGNSIYELISLHTSYVSYRIFNHEDILKLNGMYHEVWEKTFNLYFEDLNEKQKDEKLKIISSLSLVRALRFCIRHNEDEKTIEYIKQKLIEVLE